MRESDRNYKIIGAASGWGAQIRTCEDGPVYLRENGCFSFLKDLNWEVLYPLIRFQEKNISLSECLSLIIDFNSRLSDRVTAAMHNGFFPIVIGGDHTNAIGTWNGVAQFLSQNKDMPLGLIWIDAHMDSHTYDTTHSGAWHGMPLASLLGYGLPEFTALKCTSPVLQPDHLCLIGVRSFEKEEEELLKRLKVKIYYMDEVKRRGLKVIFEEALVLVNKNTKGFGISLDVDAVDPQEAPGTGCFEPNGLSSHELLSCLPLLLTDKRLRAFEYVEFNPHRDKNQKTFQLCKDIFYHFAKGGIEQRIASVLPPERNPNFVPLSYKRLNST